MFFNLKNQPVVKELSPANDLAEEPAPNLELVSLLLNNALTGPAAMWEDLVRRRKLDYSALVRNLWNILVSAPGLIDEVVERLTDEDLINYSGVLPYEFVDVVASFEKDPPHGALRALAAISEAVDQSLVNVPGFGGRTLIAFDDSMRGRSAQFGAFAAAVVAKTDVADVTLFSDATKPVSLDLRDSTLWISRLLQSRCTAGGTNFHSLLPKARGGYDRVIIISDRQGGAGGDATVAGSTEWKQRFGGRPPIFSFDLNGYGTGRFPERELYGLAGWSDMGLEVMPFLKSDRRPLIGELEEIVLV